MKRIIMHWTAGHHVPNALDLAAYHDVIDGKGQVRPGKWPISANARPVKGEYAAHTLNLNTGSIGIAVAAMAGAKERPFNPGRAPITDAQVKALVAQVAKRAREYGIPITRQTVLTHAEVQPTLGVAQRQKWDITWLPGMTGPGDAVLVGDRLRAMVSIEMGGRPVSAPVAPAEPSRQVQAAPGGQGLLARLLAWALGIIKGRG